MAFAPRLRASFLALACLLSVAFAPRRITHAQAAEPAVEAAPEPEAAAAPIEGVVPEPPDEPPEAATEPLPGTTVAGGVAFGAVDDATVRVFAVRHVDIDTVQGQRVRRTIALPESGHGSGVIVDPRGIIATAKHVVDDMRHIAVRLPGADGAILPATVVYTDETLDFALLLVGIEERLPHVIPLPREPRVLSVRATVDAVGYPLDADRDHPQSSRGIISGAMGDGHLQLDIAVNPGNSGGPLLVDSELVGLVVAGGNVQAGVQGIGIAVPIQPVREAYDRLRRDGSFSRAQRELTEGAERRRELAVVVDGIVRLGGVELLQEAADFVEDPQSRERLDRFAVLASRTRDPDLLALLSAYFWDAAQVMMERGGGLETPNLMPPGPARDRAKRLDQLARVIARRAVEADPSIVERSPFMRYLQTGRRPEELPQRSGLRIRPSNEPHWRMVTLLGLLVPVGPTPEGGGSPDLGSGAQITALFPFTRLVPNESVRFAPFLGLSLDLYGWSSTPPVHWFVGPELGFMLRFGSRGGAAMMAAWTPGAYSARIEVPCTSGSFGREHCDERRTVGSMAMFHFALLAKGDPLLFGMAVRVGRAANGEGDRYLVIAPTFGGNF